MTCLRLFTAFCVIAPAAANAECRMSPVSHLPFTYAHGHLHVPVTLDQKPADMIFDTGSFTTIVTNAAADRLQLAHMHGDYAGGPLANGGQIATFYGIGGGSSAMAVTARTVDIGGLKARNFNLYAADFGGRFSDGLLSVDVISKYDVDLDFPENQIVLYYPLGDCRAPAAFLEGPLYAAPLLPFGDDRRPRVTVSIGGHDVIAMVDTGASSSAIFRHTAERLGIEMQSLALNPHFKSRGVGADTVNTVTHVFPSVAIGELSVENMRVDILDDHAGEDNVEMLLGNNFQRAVHLWISYSSGTLIMQAPPRPSKKLQ